MYDVTEFLPLALSYGEMTAANILEIAQIDEIDGDDSDQDDGIESQLSVDLYHGGSA